MAFPLAILAPLVGIFNKTIDKIAPDKISQKEKIFLKDQLALTLSENKDDMAGEVRQFFLAYEGAAADLPKSVQILRGSLRTVLTYTANIMFFTVIGSWIFGWFVLPDGGELGLKYLFYMTAGMDAWWFGDRLISHTGFSQLLKGRGDPPPK